MKMKRDVLSLFIMMCFSGAVMADAGNEKMSGDNHMGTMPPGHWMAPEKDAKRLNPVPADNASRDRGRKLFEENCVSCHGLTGRGNGPIAARLETLPADLAAMAGQHPDGDFAWKIAEGRGVMPAWKKILSEKQIWDVVNYLQKVLPRPGDDSHSHETRGHRH